MATSENGYTVHVDQSQLAVLPWVTGRVLPGDVWTVLDYLCRRYHAEVEPIRKDWSWGYAYRAIRGQTSGYSNHASGTAIDLNAPRHPLGSRGTFTDAQVRAIRSILNALGGAVRWGGDYQRRPDEMHFEIDATPRRVAEVAAAIRAEKLGGIRPAPGLPGTGVNNWDGTSYPGVGAFVAGQKHAAVTLMQDRLTAHGYDPGAVDGYWGDKTRSAVAAFQRAQGWTGADADGIPGPATWTRLLDTPDPIDPLEEIMSWYDSKEEFELAMRQQAHHGAFSAIGSRSDHLGGIVYTKTAEVLAGRAPAEDAARRRAVMDTIGGRDGIATALRAELAAHPGADPDQIADAVAARLVDGVEVTVAAKQG